VRSLALLALLVAGCGASAPRAHIPAVLPPPGAASTALPSSPPSSEGTIQRAALDSVLDAGIGLFLQKLETEPDLRDGRFVGFRIRQLRDQTLFAGVDLAAGDTILEVNGEVVERPEHAYRVWTGLRVASELSVVLLRGDQRRELHYAIVD
jgi:hypothetical protein